MNRGIRTYVLLALGTVPWAASTFGQDGMLVLREGRGQNSQVPYDGATVEFLDVSIEDQLIHLADDTTLPLRMRIRYRVDKTAPVVLNSRFGTEFWHLHNHSNGTTSGLHTWEDIDMSKRGEAVAKVSKAVADPRRGDMLAKGLCGIVGHHLFLVDRPDGQWLGTTHPPALLQQPQVTDKLTFTAADLTTFTIAVSDLECTWQAGGVVRAKITVTDAGGESFPIINTPVIAECGNWRASMTADVSLSHRPSGWLTADLPGGSVPASITIRTTVGAMTPSGPVTRKVTKTFQKGHGHRSLRDIRPDTVSVALPRTADGKVRETRALWVNSGDWLTREQIDAVVERADRARLNVLITGILRRAGILATSRLLPVSDGVEEGLDPLAYLLEKAHAKGLEVHPWFTVTYRRSTFRNRFGGVDMVDAKGNVLSRGADIHRPRYRDFIVNVMADVARRYQVDGIHLDYIRSMGQCYCDDCAADFRREFGKSIREGTEAEWVTWQKETVADIVQRTAVAVRTVRPGAIVSAAVFSDMRGGAVQGQDAPHWTRQGWLDLAIPMDYKMVTALVQASEMAFLKALDDDTKLVTGLSLYQRSGSVASPRPPDVVKEQVHLVRSLGIHGYCLFAYTHLSDAVLEALGTELNREEAIPYFRAR